MDRVFVTMNMEISMMLNHWFSKMLGVFFASMLLLSISPGITSVSLLAHEEVQSKRRPENAWKLHSEKYTLDLQTEPGKISAASQVKLIFTPGLRDEPGKKLGLTISNEKPMHLIVVSRDLKYFDHVHPEMNDNGSLSVSTEFHSGQYLLFADITPEGEDHNQVFRYEVETTITYPSPVPSLVAQSSSSTPDGYSVTLTPNPKTLLANKSAELILTIEHNGKPVKDLQPYLGALGHMVIISEDTKGYLHTHSGGHESMPAMKQMSVGPDVSFRTLFPIKGKYKVWAQFNHGGKIHTADFVVDVKP